MVHLLISEGNELKKSEVDSVGTPYNVALGQGDVGLERYFQESTQSMSMAYR